MADFLGFDGELPLVGPPPTSAADSQLGGGEALVLSGEDFRRFLWRFNDALESSHSKMNDVHAGAQLDRKYYRTVPREPQYKNGPTVTTGLSADFADGLIAHFRDAVEQRPLASFTPETRGIVGNSDAHEVAAVYTSYLEREINRSGSRRVLAQEVNQEAVIVGTGIVRYTMAEYPDGELFVQAANTVRLENFFVDRIAVNDLKDTFCAYRFKRRFYQLEEDAENGLIDRGALENLNRLTSDSEDQIPEEKELHFSEGDTAFEEENRIITLYRGYMRFRPRGQRRSVLYECLFHRATKVILSLRENPAAGAFDHPPLALVRIGRQPGYLFGRGIIQRLRSEQEVADNAINTHLALNDKVAAPPIQYNVNNPVAEALARAGGRVIEPGMWIPSYGPPDRPDVWQMQFTNPGLALQDWGLAIQMAQRRTFDDQAFGRSGSTRKTLGQVQSELDKGTLKMRLDLADIAYDMGTMVLPMYWALMVKFKIDPAGIVSAGPLGKVLGSREVPGQDYANAVINAGVDAMMQGGLDLPEMVELEQIMNDSLTRDRVPSARRQDLTISLTGTKIIADKIGELEKIIQVMPQVLQLIPLGAQDTFTNYWVADMLRKAGFDDVDRRWPEDPGLPIEQAQQLAAEQALQGGQQPQLQPGRNELMADFNETTRTQSAR